MVFIQITLNEGRTVVKKKALYSRICELLAQKPGVRPEDVMINLIEVSKANWSYGKGRPDTFPESRQMLARRALLRTANRWSPASGPRVAEGRLHQCLPPSVRRARGVGGGIPPSHGAL